jgi:hypothetical protein
MIAFKECLEKSKLTSGQKKKINDQFDMVYKRNIENGSSTDAATSAATDIALAEMNRVSQKKRRVKLQLEAIQNQWDNISTNAKKNMAEWDDIEKNSKIVRTLANTTGTRWLFYKPSYNREIQKVFMQIDSNSKGMNAFFLNKIRTSLDRYMTGLGEKGGLISVSAENKDFLNKVWRAAGGETIDNAEAMKAGKEIRDVFDQLHAMYDNAGGVLGKLENWMPQIHNSKAINTAGYRQWFDDVINTLDFDRIRDSNGMLIASSADVSRGIYSKELDAFMENVFDTLSTDGLKKIEKAGEEGKVRGKSGGSISLRRGHQRVLHFKNPEAQLNYNSKYGTEDLYGQLLTHIQSMSKDISVMKAMGPTPDSLVSNINMRLANKEKLDNFTLKMHDVLMGRTAMTGSESDAYKMLRGTQSFLQAAQLGSAVIPAIGDSVYVGMAAHMSGMDGLKAFRSYFSSLPSHEIEGHIFVSEASLGNFTDNINSGESLISMSKSGADKYMEAGQKTSSLVMNASFLSRLTEHGRNVMANSAFMKVAANRDVPWETLSKDFREIMENTVGITKEDWDVIRSVDPVYATNTKIGFTFPSAVADKNIDVALKYESFIQHMRRLATNEPDLRTKTVTTQGLSTTDPLRMGVNMISMYRAFPITMMNNYVRTLATRAAKSGQGWELGAFLALTTMSGMGALWMKDVLKNRSPREVSPSTVGQAVLQGGALGIFGDFVNGTSNRFGQSLGQTLAGPMIGFFGDTAKLFTGDALDAGFSAALDGDFEGFDKFRAHGVQWLKRYTPGASLWYLRAGMSYTIGESTDRFFTGDLYDEIQGREQRRMIDAGQDYLMQ